MKMRPLPLVLVLAFAVLVGDFAFRTWNPSPTPEYMAGGIVRPLQWGGADAAKKHLYLRRTWYLTEAPERAWLQVLGHDCVEVYVNGRKVAVSPKVSGGRIGGVITDISFYLHSGRNAIAIHVPQLVLHRPPAVAIAGECEFADGTTMSLGGSDGWLANDVYDRRGAFWFETQFQDDHWRKPDVGEPVLWRAQVAAPPRAISQPRRSQWITPAESTDGAAVMARVFELPFGPREGWLRVVANGPYSVAINGWVVSDDRSDLAVKSFRPTERTLDISPMLRSGTNTVSVRVKTAGGEAPRLRTDLEATATSGERVYVATDGNWRSAAGLFAGWESPDLATGDWRACRPEIGYLGVVPRSMMREMVEIDPPVQFWIARGAARLGWIALLGLVAVAGSAAVQRVVSGTASRPGRFSLALPYVALLPSTVAAAAGGIMTWDLAWTVHEIYQPFWLLALSLLVVMQWLIIVLIATWPAAMRAEKSPGLLGARFNVRRVGMAFAWALLLGAALWLRVRDITAEPIHHDEVTGYMFTMSVLERGFPGGQVHPEIPFGYCATNELTYYPTALCALFVDDPRLVLRIPAVFFSMTTLVLIAWVGWRWFNPYVGFVAAVLFAFSPHVIAMANFGRYLSQEQFFALATMYFSYEAVRRSGPLNTRALWGAAITFIAMYLSWEGTGMFALGLGLAVVFHCRDRLRSLVSSPTLYVAATVVALVVVGQNAHRVLQQTQRLWYGEGISSLTVKPMWRYPFFQYDFFLINSTWTRDALLPMIALAIACVMAVGHRWRFPLRFSLICLLTNAGVMAAFLPVRTNRYAYHLTQIFILIAAAVLVAGTEAVLRQVREKRLPLAYRWYARSAVAAVAAAGVIFMSGWFVRTSEMSRFANSAFDMRQLRVPDWEGPTQYMKNHLREGDAIISIFPHSQNFMFASHHTGDGPPRTVNYWLESRLILQATIGDFNNLPLDRRSGAVMLYNLEQVEQLFASHQRVWYCTMRFNQSKINDSVVSRYLRENMDVVYEDYSTALMFRDANHRPAPVRLEEEQAGQIAAEFFLK